LVDAAEKLNCTKRLSFFFDRLCTAPDGLPDAPQGWSAATDEQAAGTDAGIYSEAESPKFSFILSNFTL
jgi:hypothetical protein